MLYETVRKERELGVAPACRVLQVSKTAYRTWLAREPELPPGSAFTKQLHDIASEFPRYGYRRVTAELRRRGIPANHKRVLRVMREESITCKRHVFTPRTTDSEHGLPVYPNLARDLVVSGLNQLWVADITYVRLRAGFAYLAAVIDVFSRKCVGWSLERGLDAGLALNALHSAISCRNGTGLAGLVHHSDQGVQYASKDYMTLLEQHGIRISMSRKGNPYDNAFAESFMKTFKYEEVNMNEYESFDDAFDNIERFIEEVYNKRRLHSSIGYLPPDEFEQQVLRTVVA